MKKVKLLLNCHRDQKGSVKVIRQKSFKDKFIEVTLDDNLPTDHFGRSGKISPDGSTLIVGAYGTNECSGRVYVFHDGVTRYTLTQIICSPFQTSYSAFGRFMDLSKDKKTLVISEPNYNNALGAVHIYELFNGNYKFKQSLLPDRDSCISLFGHGIEYHDSQYTPSITVYAHTNKDLSDPLKYIPVNGVWLPESMVTKI